jgi:hypothetical protein
MDSQNMVSYKSKALRWMWTKFIVFNWSYLRWGKAIFDIPFTFFKIILCRPHLSWVYFKFFFLSFIRTLTKITPYTRGQKERNDYGNRLESMCELIKSVAKEFNKIPNNWENAQQIWEYKKEIPNLEYLVSFFGCQDSKRKGEDKITVIYSF